MSAMAIRPHRQLISVSLNDSRLTREHSTEVLKQIRCQFLIQAETAKHRANSRFARFAMTVSGRRTGQNMPVMGKICTPRFVMASTAEGERKNSAHISSGGDGLRLVIHLQFTKMSITAIVFVRCIFIASI